MPGTAEPGRAFGLVWSGDEARFPEGAVERELTEFVQRGHADRGRHRVIECHRLPPACHRFRCLVHACEVPRSDGEALVAGIAARDVVVLCVFTASVEGGVAPHPGCVALSAESDLREVPGQDEADGFRLTSFQVHLDGQGAGGVAVVEGSVGEATRRAEGGVDVGAVAVGVPGSRVRDSLSGFILHSSGPLAVLRVCGVGGAGGPQRDTGDLVPVIHGLVAGVAGADAGHGAGGVLHRAAHVSWSVGEGEHGRHLRRLARFVRELHLEVGHGLRRGLVVAGHDGCPERCRHGCGGHGVVVVDAAEGVERAVCPAPGVEGRPGREDGPELGGVDGERLGRGGSARLLFPDVDGGLRQDALLVVRVHGSAHVPRTEGPGLVDHERACSESTERNPEAGLGHGVAERERRGVGCGGIAGTALPIVQGCTGCFRSLQEVAGTQRHQGPSAPPVAAARAGGGAARPGAIAVAAMAAATATAARRLPRLGFQRLFQQRTCTSPH